MGATYVILALLIAIGIAYLVAESAGEDKK